MKYQHAEALALALHSCKPKNANASEGAVFVHIVSTVAAFVDAQPTLYGGKRFTEVAFNGKQVTMPTNWGLGKTPPPQQNTPVVDEHGNLIGYALNVAVDVADDADEGPPSDPKAEAKTRRAARRAKRQAEADAALLAAIAANGAGQGNSAQP